MKKLCWMMGVLVCAALGAKGDSITFKEIYKDVLQTYHDDEFGGFGYDVFPQIVISARGTVTVPGMKDRPLDELKSGSISLGEASLEGEDTIVTGGPNNLLVRSGFYYDEDEEGDLRFFETGRITFTRNGDVISFVASFPYVFEESAAAGQFTEAENGIYPGSLVFRLQMDDLGYSRNVYYKAMVSHVDRTVRVGGGEGEPPETEVVTLASVIVNGAADFTKPTVSITSPKPNQRLSNEVATITGKAGDTASAVEVFVRVNEGDFQPAEISDGVAGTWSINTPLRAGTNTVEAYAVDQEENVSATARVKCFFVVPQGVTILIVNEGNTVTGVTNGQVLEIGRSYKATAKPHATNLFSYWSNRVTATSGTNVMFTFLMETGLVLEANFIANPWLPNAGVYNGLFLQESNSTPTNAGFITMKLSDKGKLTGKVIQGTAARVFSGQLDLDGNATVQISRAPALALELAFALEEGDGHVTGSVSNIAWQAALRAVRQRSNAPLAGKHTFAIPGADAGESASRPAGDGAGVLTVLANGAASLAGNLGEGAPLTAASGLSKDGDLPVHAVQFAGKGFFIGWLNVSAGSAPLTVTGDDLTWFKPPALPGQKTYLNGFNEVKELLGARYTPPPRGSNVLNWTTGVLLLDGGHLGTTISNALTVAGATVTSPGNTNSIVVTVTASSGKIGGAFLHPDTKSPRGPKTTLNGYVLQMPDGDVGRGWFISTNESGFIDLHKAAP